MGTTFSSLTMSLDGFVAGRNASPNYPLGDGSEGLPQSYCHGKGVVLEMGDWKLRFHNNFQRLPEIPNPALKTLNRLIGKWRITGPEVEGEISYDWMEGEFFFIQRFDLVNSGTPAKGIEYSGFDEDTQTIRTRLMGTDGARFTYTYEMDGDTLFYWFGDKGSDWFSKGRFASDGRSVSGRWHMPQKAGGTEGYDYMLIRIE